MSKGTGIRCERHALATTPEIREDVQRTIAAYRRAVRALCGVIFVHWPQIAAATSKCGAVEALFHATKQRPAVRYPVLDRMLGKMPSYLRRAAIEHAFGAVASFQSNWSNWLEGKIGGRVRQCGSRTPTLGAPRVYPTLYGGHMVRYGKGLHTVQIKLLGADGQWRLSPPLRLKGRFKRLLPAADRMDLSPSLIMQGSKVALACPVATRGPRYLTNKAFAEGGHRVCAIDVGINTAATAAIVDTTGTVMARTFLTCGRHNDRRDRIADLIAAKRRASGPPVRGVAHCVALHRRIKGLNLDAVRQLASQVMAFAAAHGAKAVVIEALKGWHPKGPSKAMRKRFHRFHHRMLVKAIALKAQELGVRVLEVDPRGTSRWAYDGSGKVVRDKANAQLATFASGKRYNADLNGACNIAARGLAMLLGIKNSREGEESQAAAGKSSGAVARMPLVLADIWAWAKARAQDACGHANRPARPAGVLT